LLDVMKYWMTEREAIRIQKDRGLPKPWTKDPILREFKFCNVRREDDAVTRWFAKNWRNDHYWPHRNFIPAIILGRTINWPDTLNAIGFPEVWNPSHCKEVMDRLQKQGRKVYTGAYMITAGPTGVSKNDWVLGNAETYFTKPPIIDSTSIQQSWENIIAAKYPCVGPFIAGQVIADLKQTDHLLDAKDWRDWAPIGPGSARGLNRLHGRPTVQGVGQTQAVKEMREVKQALDRGDLCLQDIQNCLCEFDKYMRVKTGQGKPRSSYPGV
jgi:hypothetical protein